MLAGKPATEIVERDDGFVMAFDARYLVAPFRKWDDAIERRAMRHVRGRVLDVGCGGGRVCLHLQERGLEVVGIDSSPGAIQACRRRGVRDVRLVPLDAVDESLGSFDTFVFLGQNFGLLGTQARARRLLRRLRRMATARGRIVAETYDPHAAVDTVLRRLRVRVRYRDLSTPWTDWLQVSPDELRELLKGTGWRLSRTLGDGPSYVAVIDTE